MKWLAFNRSRISDIGTKQLLQCYEIFQKPVRGSKVRWSRFPIMVLRDFEGLLSSRFWTRIAETFSFPLNNLWVMAFEIRLGIICWGVYTLQLSRTYIQSYLEYICKYISFHTVFISHLKTTLIGVNEHPSLTIYWSMASSSFIPPFYISPATHHTHTIVALHGRGNQGPTVIIILKSWCILN